jgi:hypothetical protein
LFDCALEAFGTDGHTDRRKVRVALRYAADVPGRVPNAAGSTEQAGRLLVTVRLASDSCEHFETVDNASMGDKSAAALSAWWPTDSEVTRSPTARSNLALLSRSGAAALKRGVESKHTSV